MEQIRDRLRLELDRLGLGPADAARAAGLPDSQGLRDVLANKKRLSAELLAVLTTGAQVDALYVLTGERGKVKPAITPAEAIDAALFTRIADRLDALAISMRKRWPERTKVEQVVKIYNYLAHDAGVVADDDKIERTLRLVVNQ